MNLYHFTCEHCGPAIRQTGLLLPNAQAMMPGNPRLVWLTDMAEVDEVAKHLLGLQSTMLSCDRSTHRFIATDTSTCVPWREWVVGHPLPLDFLSRFTYMRSPRHWWVSEVPVPVVPA